jgi:hypothetical protein
MIILNLNCVPDYLLGSTSRFQRRTMLEVEAIQEGVVPLVTVVFLPRKGKHKDPLFQRDFPR